MSTRYFTTVKSSTVLSTKPSKTFPQLVASNCQNIPQVSQHPRRKEEQYSVEIKENMEPQVINLIYWLAALFTFVVAVCICICGNVAGRSCRQILRTCGLILCLDLYKECRERIQYKEDYYYSSEQNITGSEDEKVDDIEDPWPEAVEIIYLGIETSQDNDSDLSDATNTTTSSTTIQDTAASTSVAEITSQASTNMEDSHENRRLLPQEDSTSIVIDMDSQ